MANMRHKPVVKRSSQDTSSVTAMGLWRETETDTDTVDRIPKIGKACVCSPLSFPTRTLHCACPRKVGLFYSLKNKGRLFHHKSTFKSEFKQDKTTVSTTVLVSKLPVRGVGRLRKLGRTS